MKILEQLPLWNHAAIRVLDVRRSIVQSGESVLQFRLPASAFIYVVIGEAKILIDRNEYVVDHCFVCHAGKGATLDIVQVAEKIDYYIIYYKAAMVLPCRRDLLSMFENNNPFQIQYGLVPSYPLSLLTKVEQIYKQWQLGEQLEKFHVRALFHQFVYEMLQQLHNNGKAFVKQPDIVSQSIRYMEEHFASPISLEDLASALHCSTRQLQRAFKEKLRMGPIEYLIQVRMDHAQAMLVNTNVSLKSIAESVGYGDSYYFSRAFKKYSGVAPIYFRHNSRINPFKLSRKSIGTRDLLSYSVDDDNHYRIRNEGAYKMNRSSKPLLAVSLMLSLMLFLGACSTGSGTTTRESSQPTSQTNTVTPSASAEQAAQQSYPVVIKTLKGDFTLEQRPERIAVLDTQFVDHLVALSEQPAGSVTADGDSADFPSYLTDKLKDVKLLGTRDEPNLEAIVAMAPDFIICTEFQEKIYDSLTKIAPTVMLDRNEDWRDTLITFGKIVGNEQEATLAVDAYKQKIDKLKAELALKLNGESVALIRPRDDGIRVHTPSHRTAAILHQDLGLVAPEQVKQEKDTAYHISLEALPDVGADHYFLLKNDMFKSLVEEYEKTEVWKSIDAVKQNKVYTVDTTLWIAYYGPIAINLVVDQIAETLLGAT
ncbi:AraC family transcriptional regulator [Paenibacillus sp. GSMTC-2017]|uniref:AraC family transcriptional regulator n=1 Tax=Paenibacillus sp. GSMTC-2017 TaxID=2794350 RepID=UPI0018D8A434|nr:AraC family transcriptional regulator [Paenibacillus sp. GSMTC-2017]MBH5318401.1 AraC family transcriptional regulator [Paenibacillus sp. GSMTC-2017]